MYEADLRKPDFDLLGKLSDFFHVSVDFLLGTATEDSPNHKRVKMDFALIPLVKELPFATAILSQHNVLTYFSTPVNYLKANYEHVWHCIREEDMMGTDLQCESWALIRLKEDVRNGDLAAVHVNYEDAVIREVFFEDKTITLTPKNRMNPSNSYLKAEIQICGKVELYMETHLTSY